MTNEEAAWKLQACVDLVVKCGEDWLDERDLPVLITAIKALESKPKNRLGVGMKEYEDAVIAQEEALQLLDAIRMSGRLDYGDYCDLHDAISLIMTQ